MTGAARWWFLADLHLDPGSQRSATTAEMFGGFVDSVVSTWPSSDGRLVLLGDTFELRRARVAPGRPPEDALSSALEAFPDVRSGLRRTLSRGVRVELACGNHDYPLMSPGCRRVLAEGFGDTHASVSVHPWLLHEPGAFYAEHGHQHHDLNRLPDQLLATMAATGERLAPTVLESWEMVRGAGTVATVRAVAGSVRSTARSERGARSDHYRRLLERAGDGLDGTTVRALHDVSRFEVLRAAARTAGRVGARRFGGADHDGYLRAAAAKIDAVLGGGGGPRPLCYVFGHTHVEALEALPRRGAWYANPGTWSGQVHHGRRESGPLPFLTVDCGEEAGAPVVVQLQYWDPRSGRTAVARTVESGSQL